jgi:UDP-3-O-[3-hydroxymyristoyl] glucosamine N-acyltransferase
VRVRPTPLGEIARFLGREVDGDPAFSVLGVSSVDRAGSGDLVFVRTARYAAALRGSGAGAAIVPPGVDTGGRPAIRSPVPEYDFARTLPWLAPRTRPVPGVHPTAVVASDAKVDTSASVGPYAVIGARTTVGPRTAIHAHVVLYEDVAIGAECTLYAGCRVRENAEIGDRVVLDVGAVIGSEGFGNTFDEVGHPFHIQQLGRVVIEDDVEIGANTTIQRASFGETRIRRNAKLDGQVVISHNCEVGEDVLMVGQSGLAGSTVLGRGVIVMGQAATAGHVRVGDGALLGGRAAATKDVAAKAHVWGFPAVEQGVWQRRIAAIARLPRALRRLREVERRLDRLEGRTPEGDP